MSQNNRTETLAKAIGERVLVLDGAMGTNIQDLSLTPQDFGGIDYEGCNEFLNVTRPEIIREIHNKFLEAGADIISVPSAFTQTTGRAHWHVLLRARAIETGCFVVAPAQTGNHYGKRKTFGHSLIVDPFGKILAEAEDGPCVVIADLNLKLVHSTRLSLPSLQHDTYYTTPPQDCKNLHSL